MSSPTSFVTHAVRAGAGAGKTYHLTHKVMDVADQFFTQHKRWPTLQVTTFTRKATQELNERLLHLAMEEKPHLVDFVTSRNLLRVSTIDAVLDGFLKKHGTVIGLSADFSYISAADAKTLSKKILKRVIESNEVHKEILVYFSFYQILNLLSEAVFTDIDNYKLIDTDTLKEFLAEQLATIRKKTEGLVEKIQGADLSERWTEAEQVLSQVALLLRKEDWKQSSLSEILEHFDTKGLKSKKEPASEELFADLKELLKDLETLCKPAYDPGQFEFHIRLNHLFYDLLRDYQDQLFEEKKKLNKLQISDLAQFSLKMIRNFPDAAQTYSKEIDYWLIDEFQDTSPIQIEILDALMGGKPFYFVGDPQQSIYLFRGARSAVFLDRIEWAKSNKGKIEFLDSNWRSEPSLLGFINDVSQELGEHFAPMKPALAPSSDQPSAIFTIVQGIKEKSEAEALELDSIAQHIRNLWDKGVDLKDIAILVRKNAQLQKLSEVLTRWNLPHLIHSTGSYWLRREVQDAMALLKCIVNPHDDNTMMILLRSPYLAIPEQKLIQWIENRKASVWKTVEEALLNGSLGEMGQRFGKQLALKSEIGITAAFQKCLLELGFFDTHLMTDEGGRIEGNLWKFVHLVKEFEKERGANFVKFINDCQRAAELERTKDLPSAVETQRINLMTIHASKGLQFDYVFLPFLHENPFQENHLQFIVDEDRKIFAIRTPSSTDLQTYGSLLESRVLKQSHLKEDEESLRVFYVAFTRARKSLYLSWNQDPGKKSPARFLSGFTSEPGQHTKNSYTYLVHHIGESGNSQNISIPKIQIPLRAPYNEKWTRFQTPVEPIDLKKESPSFFEGNSYRNSFVNKRRGILFHRIMESLKYPASLNMVELIQSWFPGEEDEMA
ncbi:MAG: UvrD-helicase domain-containing protein, partial [Bdellovibrionales bacterium]|nr:UvrD-helicase domain-containing protein [Bdellovibrionales bacterium]